ncbi:U4/U6.U5 small nuclear ribonucleoprotein 27 kDa protein [Aphelenchoides besseyi]|nr:U4/U6.U5 small nuclear ribonucleoprotein 27 kDa protein [Aphelenchoides besseyi]KAI6195290.1 U4/U6.U5 small nuclear ribonucleoprotein 27 kDa protein [Aphelenchoides besseyi]
MSSADVDRKRRHERDDDVDDRRSERKRHRHENNRDARDNGRERSDYRDRHYDERNKRRRSRTRSNSRERQASKRPRKSEKNKIDLETVVVDEEEMMRQMGFAGFDTTKNKKVEGNIDGVTKVNKSRKYRQYMNRKGGFNRPLDYIA